MYFKILYVSVAVSSNLILSATSKIEVANKAVDFNAANSI